MDGEEMMFTILFCAVILGATLSSIFSTDSTAQKIEACMTQPGMQYLRYSCVPIENK